MARSARCTPANRTRRVALLLAPVVGMLAVPAATAAAQPEGDDVIVLPGASSAGGAAERPAAFNLNGIAATPDGGRLVVAHSANGAVYTVDPETGSSTRIAGVDVPSVDGIQLEGTTSGGCRTSWTRWSGPG